MSLREQFLDLLKVGPATGTALASDTLAPLDVTSRVLQAMVTSGEIRRVDNVYHLVKPMAPTATNVPKEPDMTTKQCARCESVLPLDKFGDDCRTPDGKARICRDCRGKSNAKATGKPKATKPAAKPKALREVVAKHVAKPNGKGSPITAAIAELKLKRAALDQAIAALEGVE